MLDETTPDTLLSVRAQVRIHGGGCCGRRGIDQLIIGRRFDEGNEDRSG
jgi:hypothetical protein